MKNNYEDAESYFAFDTLFYQIKVLQKSQTTLNHQNAKALEKCHEEIKNLFAEAVNHKEKE